MSAAVYQITDRCPCETKTTGIISLFIFYNALDTLEQVDCEIPQDKSYPDCKNRVQLLRKNWQTNSCYKEYDVDGTICSLVIYLSEVESWCPLFPWRKYMKKKERRREKVRLWGQNVQSQPSQSSF